MKTLKEIVGVVENGQIKLPPAVRLPDGLEVRVTWEASEHTAEPFDRDMLTEEDIRADLAWATGKRFAS